MPVNEKPIVHKNVIATNVFIRKGNKYIVLKRSKLKKYAPNIVQPVGGKLELDEDPFVGAVREVKEEIGIDVKNMRLEAVIVEIHHRKDSPVNWLVFYFSADYKSGKIKDTEEGEVLLLTKNQIKESKLFPSVRSIIDTIFNPKDGVVFTTNYYRGFESGMQEISRNVCVVN